MLILGLIFLMVVLILSATLFARVANFLRFGSNSILREQAVNLAEAGIDNAIWQLNKTAGNCPSPYCGTEQVVGTTGSFIVTIQDKTASLKTITSTGYIPNATTPRAKRTIKTDVLVSSETVSFRYAVQVGTGGVDMSNSSIINGNVYTNGSIIGANSSRIKGDAYAVGTINDPPCTPSPPAPAPGCIEHESQPPSQIPDITAIVSDAKTAAETGGIINCAETPSLCTIDAVGEANVGPKKYINGDLSITNNITATLKGPIWIENNDFSMSQGNTILKLDESFGSNNVAIIVDGTIDLTQGGTFQPTSATPKGYIMLVSNSTSNQAIQISQSGSAAIFYSLNGGAQLSQSASVTSLVAQTLTMTQNSQLTYDSGLASASFTTGPGGSWQVKRGTYRFTSSP